MSGKISRRKVFDRIYEAVSAFIITLAVLFAAMLLCGVRAYRVKSGSMGDLIPLGSACFVSTYTGYDSIRAGDIISFRVSDEMLVTHRVIRVTDEGFITQGDENDTPDPDPVTRENYIGRTFFALPGIGSVLGVLDSLWGRIVLGVIVLAVLLTGMFYKRGKE